MGLTNHLIAFAERAVAQFKAANGTQVASSLSAGYDAWKDSAVELKVPLHHLDGTSTTLTTDGRNRRPSQGNDDDDDDGVSFVMIDGVGARCLHHWLPALAAAQTQLARGLAILSPTAASVLVPTLIPASVATLQQLASTMIPGMRPTPPSSGIGNGSCKAQLRIRETTTLESCVSASLVPQGSTLLKPRNEDGRSTESLRDGWGWGPFGQTLLMAQAAPSTGTTSNITGVSILDVIGVCERALAGDRTWRAGGAIQHHSRSAFLVARSAHFDSFSRTEHRSGAAQSFYSILDCQRAPHCVTNDCPMRMSFKGAGVGGIATGVTRSAHTESEPLHIGDTGVVGCRSHTIHRTTTISTATSQDRREEVTVSGLAARTAGVFDILGHHLDQTLQATLAQY